MNENEKTAKEMLEALVASGLRQCEIAEIIKTNPPQVSRILGGQAPRYGLGKRIERAYASVVQPVALS